MAHVVRDDDDIAGLAARVAALEAAVERLTQALEQQRFRGHQAFPGSVRPSSGKES